MRRTVKQDLIDCLPLLFLFGVFVVTIIVIALEWSHPQQRHERRLAAEIERQSIQSEAQAIVLCRQLKPQADWGACK